jgi:hypothetical protein
MKSFRMFYSNVGLSFRETLTSNLKVTKSSFSIKLKGGGNGSNVRSFNVSLSPIMPESCCFKSKLCT